MRYSGSSTWSCCRATRGRSCASRATSSYSNGRLPGMIVSGLDRQGANRSNTAPTATTYTSRRPCGASVPGGAEVIVDDPVVHRLGVRSGRCGSTAFSRLSCRCFSPQSARPKRVLISTVSGPTMEADVITARHLDAVAKMRPAPAGAVITGRRRSRMPRRGWARRPAPRSHAAESRPAYLQGLVPIGRIGDLPVFDSSGARQLRPHGRETTGFALGSKHEVQVHPHGSALAGGA